MPGSAMSRRHFLATLGLALAGAACTGKGANKRLTATPNSIDALRSGANPVSLFGSLDAHIPANPGENRFAFALVTADGGVITGGNPQVYIARTRAEAAQGPFTGTWYPFSGYDKTGDRSPRSPVPGTYSATIQVPSAGNWLVL